MANLIPVKAFLLDNGEYEDLPREEKITMQEKYCMIAWDEITPAGKWLLLDRKDFPTI